MSAVTDLLPVIRERIERYRGEGINEMNTKAVLIAPMLNALGWDDEDLEQVHREYKYRSSDNPVDYALMDRRMPRLFVEAKALGKNLDEPKWARQIMGYASVAGVEWVVLTDGNEYRIYNSHATVPVEEKLLRTIRLSDDDARVKEVLDLLTRDGLQENRLGVHWQAQFVDRQVQEVLKGLFIPEPDKLFVNWLTRRLADLTRGDVSASLRRVRARFDFPGASVDGTDVPAAPEESDSDSDSSEQQPPKQPGHMVRLRHLVAAGLIPRPIDLHTTYLGQVLAARIETDGSVTFQGKSFQSLSLAGNAARIAAGYGGRRPSTNGWTFWRFTDDDGQVNEIDVLRQRYLDQGGSDGS